MPVKSEMKSCIFGADAGRAGQCCGLFDQRSEIGSSGDDEEDDRRRHREFRGNASTAAS
jgi:hypothetical protein